MSHVTSGVANGDAGLVMVSPRISFAQLLQTNPVAGEENQLRLTVMFNTHVPPGSCLNISGKQGWGVVDLFNDIR